MSKHQALNTFGRSGNPVFGNKFDGDAQFSDLPKDLQMTLEGTINKTGILLLLCFLTAGISWNIPNPVLMMAGMGVGFIAAMVTIFKPTMAPSSAPVYALAQGFFLGGITVIFEAKYPGIAIQAIGLTFGTLASLLVCYKTGLIKPTENFKLMIVSATAGIALLYFVNIMMRMFGGGEGIGFIHSNGLMGIGFSLVVVAIAALNLVLDFDFIEQGSEKGLPKHMEWFGAFSIMVTLVWLYLEILRLLAKLRSR
jgi:uncharacterized YccA/Bax inhibitor family protein|tara:strand:- start:2936 stop:3694 length:759 start_codon:yes stop_codon:yes gene_type:complete